MDHEVIVVGAGPTGLFLAAELARRGVDVMILERRAVRVPGTRAIGLHPPSLSALEPSGATARILADAARITRGIARFAGRDRAELRLARLRQRFPFVAVLPQAMTEEAIGVAAPQPRWGAEVTGITPLPDGALVTARHGGSQIELRGRVVVIAAGASGRHLALPFSQARSRSYPDHYLMADVAGAREAASGEPDDAAIFTLAAAGIIESFPLPAGGRRFVAWDGGGGEPGETAEDRAARLRCHIVLRAGDQVGAVQLAARIREAAAFGIRRALLRRMRYGRVFVIGDAAHEISPIGGQGMNLGLLDAASLAPILAQLVGVRSSAALELQRWEQDRLAAARTAARIADMNTRLGRGRAVGDGLRDAARARLIAAVLATPLREGVARTYTMGFDRANRMLT